MSVIALMSDFGVRDYYVAAMKGVILQIDPKATIIDVTHDIGSQDILHGAFVLRQTMPYFPEGTIFVAVVDPGVGTRRHILAARYSNRTILAPDNGLLTLVHRDAELQEIRIVENRRFFANTLSSTFHGRDIFAPVAAHLSRGAAMDHLGPVADRIEIMDLARPTVQQDGTLDGEVMLVDRFGNLITNISTMDLSAANIRRNLEVSIADHDIGPIRATYAEVAQGELVALIGSSLMLEVAVNQGSAAEKLSLGRGAPVKLR